MATHDIVEESLFWGIFDDEDEDVPPFPGPTTVEWVTTVEETEKPKQDSVSALSAHSHVATASSAHPSPVPRAVSSTSSSFLSTRVTPKPTKQKRPYKKKALGRPKRPLSAYNLFFQHQRQVLLASRPVRVEGKPRRSHGKMGFKEMAKTIGHQWKQLDKVSRHPFEALAAQEKKRFLQEKAAFDRGQKMIIDASAGTASKVSGMTLIASTATSRNTSRRHLVPPTYRRTGMAPSPLLPPARLFRPEPQQQPQKQQQQQQHHHQQQRQQEYVWGQDPCHLEPALAFFLVDALDSDDDDDADDDDIKHHL